MRNTIRFSCSRTFHDLFATTRTESKWKRVLQHLFTSSTIRRLDLKYQFITQQRYTTFSQLELRLSSPVLTGCSLSSLERLTYLHHTYLFIHILIAIYRHVDIIDEHTDSNKNTTVLNHEKEALKTFQKMNHGTNWQE